MKITKHGIMSVGILTGVRRMKLLEYPLIMKG